MRHRARSIVAGVAGGCLATLTVGVLAASPAAARGSASLALSPNHGSASAVFTASFHVNAPGGPGACLGGQVSFTFDNQPVGSAGLDQTCTASASIQVPLGATPGPHRIHAAASGGPSGSANANFTVDGAPTNPTSSTPPSSSLPSFGNTTTSVTAWTAPPFTSQAIPTTTGPCDNTGPHATAADKGFLMIPAYSAGAHPANTGSKLVVEPAPGQLPIRSVGPDGMVPPQLGDGRHPYQYLELMEGIDPDISAKLRLAAAAGEPFGCLDVESFGGANSGYGYLSYALKDALVISVQDANPDGTPFETPAPPPGESTPSPSDSKGAKPPAASAEPKPAAKAKFEKVVLGYTSLQWEYQEAAGGAQAPIHRGAGTITPPAPSAPLSYANLIFAFGGLVAATVALMFAYHSRRRDLARRERRQRASHAS